MRVPDDSGGGVIWITGISGTGKTTVATLLAERLRQLGRPVAHLDGDAIRRSLPMHGYSRDERLALAFHYSGLATILSSQGLTVIVSTISLFAEVHRRNREHFPCYLEVLLSAPREVLLQRDAAGLYSGHQRDPVISIDIAPELPQGDRVLHIENYGSNTAASGAQKILESYLSLLPH